MRYYGVVKLMSLQKIGVFALAGVLSACAGGETSFDSPESAARLRAIQRAGGQEDRASIPRLVEMLDSDDPAVRLLAIRTLEDKTGETFGYEYWAPTYERSAAVAKWQAWLQSSENTPIKGGIKEKDEADTTGESGRGAPASDLGAAGCRIMNDVLLTGGRFGGGQTASGAVA